MSCTIYVFFIECEKSNKAKINGKRKVSEHAVHLSFISVFIYLNCRQETHTHTLTDRQEK